VRYFAKDFGLKISRKFFNTESCRYAPTTRRRLRYPSRSASAMT